MNLVRFTLLGCLAAASTASAADTSPVASMTLDGVNALIGTLNEDQRAKTLHPLGGEAQTNWTYLPGDRVGLSLAEATEDQRRLILEIVDHAVSDTGWERVEDIRALEIYLRDVAKSMPAMRDPNGYFLAVFGEPSKEGTWGLRFEGHHLSLHWVFKNGQVASAVPQFLGSNPATIPDGPKAGSRILGRQEKFARDLLASLTDAQAATGIQDEEAPGDILTRFTSRAERLPDEGLAFAELDEAQQRLVLNVLHDALAVQTPEVARAQWDKLEAAGKDGIRFLWIGGRAEGEPHYFRIQGPTFVYEYNNVQNGAKHVHTVWRDFDGDFGRDLLAEHMRAEHTAAAD